MAIDYVNKRNEYVSALNSNNKVSYVFTKSDTRINEISYFLINHCLGKYQIDFLAHIIITIYKECLSNAIKANLKRAFFHKKSIDINNPDEYNKAIKIFRKEAIENIDDYVPTLKKLGLKVQVTFQFHREGFDISIQNNVGMAPNELKRAQDRISQAYSLDDISEAFEIFSDESEGAGLGLLLNLMLLKTSGLGQNNFHLISNSKATKVVLRIPKTLNTPEQVHKILDKITEKISALPVFPSVINNVISLCSDTNINFDKIAAVIAGDPSLASGILTIANSAAYNTGVQVKSIPIAVSKLGLKAIKNLAVSLASQSILEKNYKVYQGFWNHANKCAFYCKKIAEDMKLRKTADALYLGGLLHDLGKIILYSIDKETIKEINGISVSKTAANSAKLEEISMGISHAVVGSKLAEKWNYSEDVKQIMLHHHSPLQSPEEFRTLVCIAHLADSLAHSENGAEGKYHHLEVEALNHLNIKSSTEVENLHNKLKSFYEVQSNN